MENYNNTTVMPQTMLKKLKSIDFKMQDSPMVGIVVTISPSLSLYSMVVLPAASRPTIRILISFLAKSLLNNFVKVSPISISLQLSAYNTAIGTHTLIWDKTEEEISYYRICNTSAISLTKANTLTDKNSHHHRCSDHQSIGIMMTKEERKCVLQKRKQMLDFVVSATQHQYVWINVCMITTW